MTFKAITAKHMLFILSILLILTAGITVVSAAEVSSKGLYLLEGDIVTLSAPLDTDLVSGNPQILEINGNQAEAKKAGTVPVYSVSNSGVYTKLYDVTVAGDQLEFLYLFGDRLDFSQVPYVNMTNIQKTPELYDTIVNNQLSSYDSILYGFAYPASPLITFFQAPTYIALKDAHDTGTLLLAGSPGQIAPLNVPQVSAIPEYFDYRYLPEYSSSLGFGHLNMSFIDGFQTASGITVGSANVGYASPIPHANAIAPLIAKQSLEKTIYTAEELNIDSKNLTNAKDVLSNPVSTPVDYVQAMHQLKKEMYNGAELLYININQPDLSLKQGDDANLSATVYATVGTAPYAEVAWMSSDPQVATVDQYGTVKAVGFGTAVITASTGGLTDECEVTVGKFLKFYASGSNYFSTSSITTSYVPSTPLLAKEDFSIHYFDHSLNDIIYFNANNDATRSAYGHIYESIKNSGSIILSGAGSSSKSSFDLQWANATYLYVRVGSGTNIPIGVYYSGDQTVGGDRNTSVAMDQTKSIFAQYFRNFAVTNSPITMEEFIESGEIEREALKHLLDVCEDVAADSDFVNIYTAESRYVFLTELDNARQLYADISAVDGSGRDSPTDEPTKIVIAETVYDLKEAFRSLEYADPGAVTSVVIDNELTLRINTHGILKAAVSGISLKEEGVTWTSSDETVATVNSVGVVTARSAGKATITATSVLDGGVFDSCEVTVMLPINSVFLDHDYYVFEVDASAPVNWATAPNASVQVFFNPLNADYDDVKWTSSNDSIVRVTPTGNNTTAVITAGKPGSATITVSAVIEETIFNSTSAEFEKVTTTKTAKIDIYVKVLKSQRVNILHIGSRPLQGVQLASDTMHYSGYIDYDYVPAYNLSTLQVSDEVLNMVQDFGNYDLILFDMFGDYDLIEAELKAAQSGVNSTKILSLESDVVPPDYINYFTDTDKKTSVFYKYYTQLTLNNDKTSAAFLWGEKFLLEAGDNYVSHKMPQAYYDEKKLEVLYIGKSAELFNETANNFFNNGAYGGAVNWTVLLYNSTSQQYEDLYTYKTDASLTTEDLAQIALINGFLSSTTVNFDLIICDGFGANGFTGNQIRQITSISAYLTAHPSCRVLYIRQGGPFYSLTPTQNTYYIDDNTNLGKGTFELDDSSLPASYAYLYSIIQRYGNERVSAWPYTTNAGASASIYYIHPVPGQASELKFSTLEAYMRWAQTNDMLWAVEANGGVKSADTKYFHPDRPTVGIWMFGSDRGSGMNSLIYALEKQGVNVIVGAETYDDIPTYYRWTDSGGQTKQIDAAISIKNFGLNYWNYEEGIRQLEEMNIPVLKGFFATASKDKITNISDINNMVDALNGARMTLSPNRDGIFEFIYLGYMNQGSVGVDAQINWMAERAAAWAFLNQKQNAKKDIAILYYNYPPGKADIGANYLNVIRSLSGTNTYPGILKTMNTSYIDPNSGEQLGDYDIDFTILPRATPLKDGSGGYSFEYYNSGLGEAAWRDQVMTEENLMYLMLSQGINVGSHAPGVLDSMVQEYIKFLENGGKHEDWWGCQLLPVYIYERWFDETLISDALREEIIDTWGEPWDLSVPLPKDQSGMIWEDKNGYFGNAGERYFVFPAVRMGHVWILPQPDRALASTKALSAVYHGDMAPTHQYVAFYFWLNRGMEANTGYDFIAQDWKPDAVVHFGTHGTVEFLPGTAMGMQQGIDWGPILIGRLPNIYPYIVANVGEGLTAEYRGNAYIISHLTPAMIRSGLYGDLAVLDSEIQSYLKQSSLGNLDSALSYEYRVRIVGLIYKSGVSEVLDLSAYNKYISGPVTDEKMKAILLNTTIVNDAAFSGLLKDQVHNYLDAVMENALPYGMHVYGQSPDDVRTAHMVRAMWGNFGFEELIRSVYFKDLPAGLSIPFEPVPDGSGGWYYGSKSDSDVQDFVTLYVSGVPIQTALQATLGPATPAELEQIELFIRGPVKYYEDSALTGVALKTQIKADWRSSGVDAVIIKELCTDFVPSSVATNGQFNQTRFNTVFDRFAEDFVDNMGLGMTATAAVDAALTKNFNINGYATQTWINQGVIDYVTAYQRDSYAPNLKACGDAEMYSLLNALSAGYIPVTTGNDPIQNPGVLPTGRNFYGIDPNTYPTRAAWEVGQAMGEQLLVDYYEKYGEFPSLVSFTRFGVEFIRDEGAMEACIYYLLGCKPTWSGNQYTGTGTFTGAVPVTDPNDPMFQITLSNGTVVQRPRVDILYTTAGMRDAFPMALRYIDRAVRAVNALDGSQNQVENNIQKNTNSIKAALKASNPNLTDAQIEQLALARTFAQELGSYEIGTGNLVSASGSWNNSSDQAKKDIVDLYLKNMGYIYTDEIWGNSGNEAMNQAMVEALKQLLMRADASMFASSSNLYNTLDNDDVYQYFGIMNMVSQYYGGKLPEMYLADTSNVANYKSGDKVVMTMQEAIKKDLDSTFLNPVWVEGMIAAGYSGSTMMAEFVDNLFGWAVATNGELVSDKIWSQVLETYVTSGLLDGDSKYAYASQSITGRMADAAEKGYWGATSDQLQQVSEAYVRSVLEYGMACCHHTCGNPSLDATIAGQMSVLGLTPEEEERYWQIVKQATDRDKPAIKSSGNASAVSSGGGYGMQATVVAGNPAAGDGSDDGEESSGQSPGIGLNGTDMGTPVSEVAGYELTVSKLAGSVQEFIQNPSFSSTSIIALVIVVLVVAAVFYGFKKRNI